MKNAKTFPMGGIHPRGNKGFTHDKPIKNAVIPSVCHVPLSQHIGSPAECLVQVGDEIKEEPSSESSSESSDGSHKDDQVSDTPDDGTDKKTADKSDGKESDKSHSEAN